jgi:hypothetical protein
MLTKLIISDSLGCIKKFGIQLYRMWRLYFTYIYKNYEIDKVRLKCHDEVENYMFDRI